ncbi:MAG: DUF72 domain-containing protein [Calditrichaeota bacterium]|nr:DUF72 domain-containing protein [Calditrichota bacterium]
MPERIKNYYLGCPIWGNPEWKGALFTREARAGDFLPQYGKVFNTVEGNNTFYGLPKPGAIERWGKEVPEDFRFSFKFPRRISHELQLQHAGADTRDFLNALAPIAGKIGVLFLQLPPGFGPGGMPALGQYLQSLPTDFAYAVEVRHRMFFDDPVAEKRLNELLSSHHANRALFDTSTLHLLASDDPDVITAQGKKPQVPERFTATGGQPFLRYVGHKTVAPNRPRLTYIAGIVAGWLREGRTPYVFIHSPGDLYAPQISREFHQILKEQLPGMDLGAMPPWPGESEPKPPEQMSLF